MRATTIVDTTHFTKFIITRWAKEDTEDRHDSDWTHWIINKVENEHIIESFIKAVTNHNKKVVIVSDGSFHPKMKISAAAWVIDIKDYENSYIFGNNIISGQKEIQYSYRSELGGLIGAIFHWIKLSKI